MDEKLALAAEHRETYGLNACLRALDVSKGTWHYRMRRPAAGASTNGSSDEELKAHVIEIIRANPAYGYRRIAPDLEAAAGESVNHKRLRRLLEEWDLGIRRTVVKPRPSEIRNILGKAAGRLNLVARMDPGPLDALATDFTEIRYAGGSRKAWLMAMVDVRSSWAPGWAVGPSRSRDLALECWKAVRSSYADLGRDLGGVTVHHDQDAVYTSYAWLEAILVDSGARASFSENGAKGNPWIESFWARFKQENASLFHEAEDLEELRRLIDRQMHYYNRDRRHSAVGNLPPLTYLQREGLVPGALSRN